MNVLSPKKKNVYLDKINENLASFFRIIDKFDQILNELSQLSNGATIHINDIERIFGTNDDEDNGDEIENKEQRLVIHYEREALAGEKLCQLNENLNISMREIRRSWNTLEKQGAAITKSVFQLPKLIRLFLDSTKNDLDFNDSYFRCEITHLSNQFPVVGQFYYELCLEIQTNLIDLSNMKKIKHLATILELLSSRMISISAITSVTLTSSYFLYNHDHNQRQNRILSLLKVDASNYERRNERTASTKSHFIEQKKRKLADNDDDDDDDDEDEDDDKNELDKNDEVKTNPREKRFREFSSVEYNGDIYMTPLDFLESVISERPRPRIGRRQLTDPMVESILYNTPPKHRGSKRFFRDLEDAGLISFSEYLFLWVILTKPYAQFEIAFAMFDTDGNQLVDRNEFLVLGKVMSDKRMLRRQASKGVSNTNINSKNEDGEINTTLLLHFFGKNGRDTLNFTEFKRFMENFQTELLEIEFTEFSHGFKTISDLDFAEILLRYTDFDHDTKTNILKKVKKTTIQSRGITFEQFKCFFAFLNNLEEFSIAMRFHQLSNKPISQGEYTKTTISIAKVTVYPDLI
ncbi:unnamed protein product [Rotaria socialis]|uniref:EF-hand domain-containing protein n=1 Tax=Rotaria socialis TaxID=392032 RepID=A0A821EI57_9BILA|nr:unnamed protein product [Rotaria socialis]